MVAFPSNVLVIADYDKPHFEEQIRHQIDFVLSCGNNPFHLFEEIHERFNKPIFAVKGDRDPIDPFPDFVEDVHHRMVQHRRWLIGGWQEVPDLKSPVSSEGDDASAALHLSNFPYVDIFIYHSCKESGAILKYIEEKQPRYVYHGKVHSDTGNIIGETALISVTGAQVVTLS